MALDMGCILIPVAFPGTIMSFPGTFIPDKQKITSSLFTYPSMRADVKPFSPIVTVLIRYGIDVTGTTSPLGVSTATPRWVKCLTTKRSPSPVRDALRLGKRSSALVAARSRIGRKVSFKPSAVAASCWDLRKASNSVMSASSNFKLAVALPRLGEIYPLGLQKAGQMWVYTTRGVGVTFPPIRFNCPPEITVLTLRRV